jgi:prepilin-type N-terminal cleavage/methylation domain-containing protein
MNNKVLGFTIIELMVVVTIIGLLVGIGYVNFSGARAEARDDARKVNLQELQIALAVYKSQHGVYPEQGCGGTTGWTGPGPHSASWGNDADCPEYIVGLAPDFISELPVDPYEEYEDNKGFLYNVNASRSAYKLMAHNVVEVDLVDTYEHAFARCSGNLSPSCGGAAPPQTTYAVYSFGGESW